MKPSKWSSQDSKRKNRRCQRQENAREQAKIGFSLVLIIWTYCMADSLASQEIIWIGSHFFVSWFALLALTATGGCSLNPNIKI